jgi:hypothetical protein
MSAELTLISLAAALAVCAVVPATVASRATGGGASPWAAELATSYGPGGAIGAGPLEPAPRGDVARLASARGTGASARRKPARLKLKYYIGVDFQTVAPGDAQLFEIRCPNERERPLTGGTFAPAGGLVIVNSSRTNPSPGLPSSERAWYEAVLNITETPLQWKPFVTCVRG